MATLMTDDGTGKSDGTALDTAKWTTQGTTANGGGTQYLGQALQFTTGTGNTGSDRVTRTINIASRADVDVTGTITITSGTPRPIIAARATASGVDYNNGYIYSINPSSGNLTIQKVSSFTGTTLVSVTKTITTGTTYGFRFQVIGNNLRSKLWAASGSEPASWDSQTTDSTYTTAGLTGISVGAGASGANVATFDNIIVTDDGTSTNSGGGGTGSTSGGGSSNGYGTAAAIVVGGPILASHFGGPTAQPGRIIRPTDVTITGVSTPFDEAIGWVRATNLTLPSVIPSTGGSTGSGGSSGGGSTGGGTTGAYPAKVISVYKMIYSNSGAVDLSALPSGCNEIRLAFALGNPISLAGYGPEGKTSLINALKAWRAAGKRVILSVGGESNPIDMSNATSFINRFDTIRQDLGNNVDGMDYDMEASSFTTQQAKDIATGLKSKYGSSFVITMVPNGSNVSTYLPAAVAMYKAGAMDNYGQQFYASQVSLSAAEGRIKEAINAGLPASVISVGMMIASGNQYWSLDTCKTNMTAIKKDYGLRKAYLWEGARAQTKEWITAMDGIL